MRKGFIVAVSLAIILTWSGAAFAKKPVEVTGFGEIYKGKGKIPFLRGISMPVVKRINSEVHYCLRVFHNLKKPKGFARGNFNIAHADGTQEIELPTKSGLGGSFQDGEAFDCVSSMKSLESGSLVAMDVLPRKNSSGGAVKLKKKSNEYTTGMEIYSRFDPLAESALDLSWQEGAQTDVPVDKALMAPVAEAAVAKVPPRTPFASKRYLFVGGAGKVPKKFSHAMLLGEDMPAPVSFCWRAAHDFAKQNVGESTASFVVQTPPPNQQQLGSPDVGGQFMDGEVFDCIEFPEALPSGTLVFVSAKTKKLKGKRGNEFAARLEIQPGPDPTASASTTARGWVELGDR